MASKFAAYDSANDIFTQEYIEAAATAESDTSKVLRPDGSGGVSWGALPAHAASHQTGADKVYFGTLQHTSLDPTQHDSYTTTPHISATEKGYLPTSGQKDALAGSYGTPSSSNVYITESDPRVALVACLGPRRTSGDASYPYYFVQDVAASTSDYFATQAYDLFPYGFAVDETWEFYADICSSNSTYMTAKIRLYFYSTTMTTLETTSTSFVVLSDSDSSLPYSSTYYIRIALGGTNTSGTTGYEARCRGAFVYIK